jgi:hypothetical protein
MTHDIRPLRPDDLDDLRQFLTAGFHTPPTAGFAAREVLWWKYLEPRGEGDEQKEPVRSFIARDSAGSLIGHVGICPTTFVGTAIPGSGVRTLHMIDWLGSAQHRSVGASLMRKAHEGVPTQFGLGGSDAGRAVIKRGGYELREQVPVYQRVLRSGYWLRDQDLGVVQRGVRLARDLAHNLRERPHATQVRINLQRVDSFSTEILPIVEEAKKHAILTHRTPAQLGYFLRFPGQAMSGWQLLDDDARLRGFAILNLASQDHGAVRRGKIVDCLLERVDVDLWHAAIMALTHELRQQGADIAQSFGSTPWMAEALRRCGFVSRFTLEFSLRDRQGLIPRTSPFHLTPIEADYAYT